MQHVCLHCNQPFDGKKAAKFCSPKCRKAHNRLETKPVTPIIEPKRLELDKIDPSLDNSDGLFINTDINIDKYKPHNPVITNSKPVAKPIQGLKGGGLSPFQLALRKSKLGIKD